MDDLYYWIDPVDDKVHTSRAENCLDNTPTELIDRFVHSIQDMFSDDPYMWRPIRMLSHNN